jgi:hypothetical protein
LRLLPRSFPAGVPVTQGSHKPRERARIRASFSLDSRLEFHCSPFLGGSFSMVGA